MNEQVISINEGSHPPSPWAGPSLSGLLAKPSSDLEQRQLEKDQAHKDSPEGQGQALYYSRGCIMKNFIFFASVETFNKE